MVGERSEILIRGAAVGDVPLILSFIRQLAEYEKLSHTVEATEESLRRTLFGEKRGAEVVIAQVGGEAAGFALFFENYSTFLGRAGIYLEDLFVRKEMRGKGVGLALLKHVAKIAVGRGAGRLEWSVLDWNEPAIGFYKKLGAKAMEEWTIFRVVGEELSVLGRDE